MNPMFSSSKEETASPAAECEFSSVAICGSFTTAPPLMMAKPSTCKCSRRVCDFLCCPRLSLCQRRDLRQLHDGAAVNDSKAQHLRKSQQGM